ncbi:MAG TPA: 3-phosphoshikimate 1-carboxyvinyltransferase [Candidatus Limnocylindria bacterium]|nr:3-phosphoshikimate 1-carboxyvinyltransferase [Candidatus Limnocylindria bacterium]
MGQQQIHPARSITGGLEPPGDKSISHRYAMLAALAEGTSEIRHFSSAADCVSTLECLRALGADVRCEGDTVRVTGRGIKGLQRPRRALDAGNSGTTMRLLAGILAGQSFDSTLTGDGSLRRRPMRRVIEPLVRMGAQIHAHDEEFAPLEIHGRRLRSIEYTLPVPSAQVKSAVLLAGLFAEGTTSVTEPVRTRDHSELALAEFGARMEREGRTIRVHGVARNGAGRLEARTVVVPGDLSSAVFFLAAACVLQNSSVLVHNAGLNPTRTAVLDVLAAMGAPLSLVSVHGSSGELVGDIAVSHAALEGGVIEGPAVAQLIDELPMLAVLGPFTEKGIEIRDAAELRVKESDRIAAVAENLRRMGARVEERPDGLLVAGRAAGKLHGAEIDTRGDHRIAMAFAIAALGADGPSIILDAECAAVSYPDFYETLEQLVER